MTQKCYHEKVVEEISKSVMKTFTVYLLAPDSQIRWVPLDPEFKDSHLSFSGILHKKKSPGLIEVEIIVRVKKDEIEVDKPAL